MILKTHILKNFLFAGTILFVVNYANAKEIEFSPALTVGTGYSDNIELDHTNEKSSAYVRVTPSVQFKKEGARVKSQLDYNVTGLFYTSESDLNDVQHRLFANVESELIKHSIFLDLNATVSQQLLDSSRNSSSDGISGSENLTETYTYGFSPYWEKKWQDFASSTLRYNYDEVIYSGSSSNGQNSGGDDSKQNRLSLDIESGTAFTQYFWNFNYAYNDTSYDVNRSTRSETYRAVLGYHYSRRLDFTFTTGYEDYNDGRDDGGTGWRAGFIWDPSPRNHLEVEAGHRFFGNTYLMDFTHRGRLFTWNINYNDSIVDTRSQIINNNNSQQENPDNIIVPLTNFTAQYYLSRRFSGDVSYTHKKSTVRLGVFNERRYFTDSDKKDETDTGINLSWNLNVGRRTNMTTRVSWDKLEDLQINNTQDRREFSWSLSRTLTPTMTGFLTISHRENDADIHFDEYTENSISLNVTKTF